MIVSNNQGFQPNWTSPPGDTISDILRERAVSIGEFAKSIGQTPQQAKDLIEGRGTISIAIARRLAEILGGSREFWISRDFQYREDTARLHMTEPEWLASLPLTDMIKFGWLKPVPRPSEEVSACLDFFAVPNVSAWRRSYGRIEDMVALRTSPSFDSKPAAVAAWLRRGEIQGDLIECGAWNAQRFESSLSEIRGLTRRKNPQQFIPILQKKCTENGVAVVIEQAPTGCRASGATRFVSPVKALLLLSFRYLADDHFWFTFFHEAGHLVLHGEKAVFLEGDDTPQSVQEEQANEFSARMLVPVEFRAELLKLRDARAMIKFAHRVGVSPGIVVGQLQHYGEIGYQQLNSLKRRFEWD